MIMVIDWKLVGAVVILMLAVGWLLYEWIMAREHDE